MLTPAENAALTATGPGTLMGSLMRQYWTPALSSDELNGVGGAPVRVMLLGERLIAFRDTAGMPGLLAEACPHRGASLFFGRNEPGGLRCAYHGWKFNVRGDCLEMPCEPNAGAARHVRARAYPCMERGGILWAYLGPREIPPPLPDLQMNTDASAAGRVDLTQSECNWLQNLEGDLDVDHIAVLHGSNFEAFRQTTVSEGRPGALSSRPPRSPPSRPAMQRFALEVVDSPAGCTFASNVTAGVRQRFEDPSLELPELWVIGQFMFPFYAMLPYKALGAHWVVARVPMDDTHTMTFGMHSATSAIPSRELMFGPEPCLLPNSADWFGRFRPARNSANDFGFHRQSSADASGAFGLGAGIEGQATQDATIVHSMGPIADRSAEHLGPGDAVIARVRRRLLSAARALAENNTTPPGVDAPSGYRTRQGMMRVRKGRTWRDELQL